MHLGCDLIGLLVGLKKLVLKLLNEVSAVCPVHVQFFTLFSCSSSFTLGQLSMKLSNGSPRLEIQSLIVHAMVTFPSCQQKVQNLIHR